MQSVPALRRSLANQQHSSGPLSSSKSRAEIWREWRDLVNMTPKELEEWLQTDASKSVGDADSGESTGHASGRRIVDIKRADKAETTDSQWDHMAKVTGYIKRHLAQGGPDEELENSPWRHSLMNWGHDPLK